MLDLIRGKPGKPMHPPLTDVSIGAYTVGVAMLVAGTLGLEEEQMAHGALLAVSGGLLVAAPTAITGLIDWLGIEQGSPRRTAGLIHLATMVTATLVFAGAWLAQRPGYQDGDVEGLALVLGLVGLGLLLAGGYIGGTLVFVYGVRVVKATDIPLRDALVPGRVEAPRPADEAGANGGPGGAGGRGGTATATEVGR